MESITEQFAVCGVTEQKVLGVPVPTDIHVFTGQLVDAFMAPAVSVQLNAPDPMGNEKCKFVFIGIDPCGGGTQSDTAFCALTFRPSDSHPVVRVP